MSEDEGYGDEEFEKDEHQESKAAEEEKAPEEEEAQEVPEEQEKANEAQQDESAQEEEAQEDPQEAQEAEQPAEQDQPAEETAEEPAQEEQKEKETGEPANEQQGVAKSVSPQQSKLASINKPPPKAAKKPSTPAPPKKAAKTPAKRHVTATGPSEQQKMVGQIMKAHKEKQEKMKALEDKIYVAEAVEKQQVKEARPKVIVKQKLNFPKDVQEKLDDPGKSNQEKANILIDDLAKKVNKKAPVPKDVNKKIEIKQPPPESEPKPKPKAPAFNLAIGAGIKSKLESDAESLAKSTQVKERGALLEQKKIEKEKAKLQMAQMELIKQKEKQLLKQNQDSLKKENKVLAQNPDAKIKDKKATDLQYESNLKEQATQEDLVRRQLLLQLRHLREDNKDLLDALATEQTKNSDMDKQITEIKKTAKVIEVGGKFTSFGLVPQLKGTKQTVVMSDQNDEVEEEEEIEDTSKLIEPSISEIIVNRIAQQGMTLKDVYNILDNDGDGVLTMNEIKEGIKSLTLNLTKTECEQFIQLLDSNSDGILSEPEFYTALTGTLEAQKEFVAIMGDIKDVVNPIVLEERKIDLQYRKKVVLKQMEVEERRAAKTQVKYTAIAKKLKDLETKVSSVRGGPADRVAFIKQLRAQCEVLRKEWRAQQEERQKLQYLADEKKELIEEDVRRLTQELSDICVKVMQTKQQLQRTKVDYQKQELRHLAYARLNEKIVAEMSNKTRQELELMEKGKAHLQNKQKNLEAGLTKQLQTQALSNAIILIQKYIRGRVTRNRMHKRIEGYKKSQLKLLKVIYPRLLDSQRQTMELFKDCHQRKMKEKLALEEQQKLAHLEEIRKQREQQQQQQQTKKKTVVLLQSKDKLLNPSMLVATISLQKYFKMRNKKQSHPQKVFGCSFLSLNQQCQVCNTSRVEMICRKCHTPLFCKTCFKIAHKNYNRRNHRFYEITDQPFNEEQDQKDQEQLSENQENLVMEEEEQVSGDELSKQSK